MKFGIYRDYGGSWMMQSQPVRRGGKPIQFKSKKEAKKWIKENEKDKGDHYEWRILKIIKEVK